MNTLNREQDRQKASFGSMVTNRYHLLASSNGLLIPPNSFFSEIKPSPSPNTPLLSFALDTLKFKKNQSLEHFALSDSEPLNLCLGSIFGYDGDGSLIFHFLGAKSNRSLEVPLEASWCNLTILDGLNSW